MAHNVTVGPHLKIRQNEFELKEHIEWVYEKKRKRQYWLKGLGQNGELDLRKKMWGGHNLIHDARNIHGHIPCNKTRKKNKWTLTVTHMHAMFYYKETQIQQ